MAAITFFGHLLLGLGPGIAFFFVVIAPKSFVVLLSLFSAFFWLLVLLFTTAIFRGFMPLASNQPAYAGALLAAVAIEEAARYGVWQMHKRSLVVLHRMSVQSGHTFTKLDELYLALGWGYGHGAVHVLFMFGSLLPLTVGLGTAYSTTCPQMSIFLVGALNSLGMGATLVSLSVIALNAWSKGSWVGVSYAPLMHAAAALVTLGSFRPRGCITSVATQLALGLVNTWYAASIAWRQGGAGSRSSREVGSGAISMGLGSSGVEGLFSGSASADAQQGVPPQPAGDVTATVVTPTSMNSSASYRRSGAG